jgi:hypothetical protein
MRATLLTVRGGGSVHSEHSCCYHRPVIDSVVVVQLVAALPQFDRRRPDDEHVVEHRSRSSRGYRGCGGAFVRPVASVAETPASHGDNDHRQHSEADQLR